MAATGTTTGGLHTGGTGPATHDAPAMMHTDAPAKRGGLFGGGRKHHEKAVATDGGRGHGHGVKLNNGVRAALFVTELLTLAAFLIALGGLSAMQKRANSLQLDAATQLVYNDQFQSAGQTPYPTDASKQFALQWWILFFELVIFLTITALLMMPRLILRLKYVLLAFLVYVFVLATLQVNSLFWFDRSATATSVYGSRRIKATLAGALLACICNAFSIIFLGLLRDETHHHGIGGKRVGYDTTGPATV